MENTEFEKKSDTRALLLEPTQENLGLCGQRIREGKLVSFPTETVYGLGADATNEQAVLSIFEAKGRPLTDPVIVHIAEQEMLKKILLDTPERDLIEYLGSKLWPGPLTLIGPCDTDYIPSLVGSNTGTVGVRIPDNAIAIQLIKAAERPIAAPSANRFMHVSPTKYSHVFYDLYDKDIAIIKGQQTNLGVESTVAQVMENKEPGAAHPLKILIMRPGTLEMAKIQEVLSQSEDYKNVSLSIRKKNQTVEEHEASTAPGQLLKHYSPEVDCKLFVQRDVILEDAKPLHVDLSKAAIIDFGQSFKHLSGDVGAYFDLSTRGDFAEALHNLYQLLRDCEQTAGISLILVCYKDQGYDQGGFGSTLFDKIYRSASGQQCIYFNNSIYF